MGCNCRRVKKLHEKIASMGNSQNEEKVYKALINRLVQSLLIFVVLVVVSPIFAVFFPIYYFIYGGEALKAPKFLVNNIKSDE